MLTKKHADSFRRFIGYNLREIYSKLLFNFILYKSRPLTVSHKSAIVFAPHQDDETFGCGGTIALKCASGIPVKVVFLTDGKHSKPDSIQPEEIVNIRQKEAVNALKTLGMTPSEIHFLGHADGTLKHLSNEQRQQIIKQLAELLKSFRPQEVYVPHHHDKHPDHEATYNLVHDAIASSDTELQILQYPIWMLWQNPLSFHLNLQDISSSYRISIASVQNQKKQAIASYRSQITTLPPGLLNRFSSQFEIFIRS
ncbi:PIG-L family deacetylase [Aetokthonos hydrillicola Thurmond2011]|jgi:LmbE family N-acetylglucosaminyl deacetylase|uniref:PIG-L family deacetylase n=1 Tax=Aetokthonos hydrillicola Thurmond2011 TaxID=2712845 RepID=A0AAP5I3D4_9CYAN|nr:PIG-L deacetylase family protein [Aetokthonos hydrillicola]MBO3458292.1 PIG-L family deacetylase [Aetokthonos hydrillicola CCALA 1050]MBW4585854.1 PIG-L family deacetylase [Aetokthonos hydrillicola CCALA 1050]MDR9893920.1 PIG-L family deacetylase [Aetokthonos hydrillicola Thurmond2011]